MRFRGAVTASALALALAMQTTTVLAQTSGTSKTTETHKTSKKHKESAQERQLRELRESLEAQQAQIDALKQQLSTKDGQTTEAQQQAAQAQQQAAQAAEAAQAAKAAAQDASSKASEASTSVNDLKTTTAGLSQTVVTTQQQVKDEVESPSSVHYKGVTITPVAFFAAEGVYRKSSINSGINTPFNTTPFPGSNEGHISELNFSARQSRIGGLFVGDAGTLKLSGYIEADFLSAGVTSNSNQSNSYTLRQRQFWGQAMTKGGFAVTGGQMWSLVTEDGVSTNARSEKLPATIDPQYMVGYIWTRQPEFRIQQMFGQPKTGAFTLAMSVEQAQITGFTAASATSGAVPNNFFFAGTGTGGGLFNSTTTYANNVAPDVIVKSAYDMPHAHFELGGIARFLRDYYYPILSVSPSNVYTLAANQQSNTKAAGGIFGSARVTPSHFITMAVQAMAGTGVGRYGSAQLADATVRPDGTLEPIRNYHGLLSIETHPAKAWDVFAYYGGEYAQRTVYTTATGALIGYGPRNLSDTGCYALPPNPGSSTGGSPSASGCSSPTRYIQEGMIGFTYRAYDSPKFGRLQYQATYSYLQRNLWSGIGNATTPTGPRAENSMIHVSMRYYIP